jgi:hypothetical protein
MGLLRTARRAAVASAVHGRVQRRQHDRWASAVEVAPPAATAAPADTSDLLNQLERLGQLRDSGVLTEDEFAAQKARLLG